MSAHIAPAFSATLTSSAIDTGDMARFFIKLSYRGAAYHGWQRQPGDISVQQVVEQALAMVTRTDIAVTGAGRTDAGVNARLMVAHADIPDDIAVDARFVRAVNAIVGRDIAIHDVVAVAPDAHARFDAVERTYHYYVHTSKDPFLQPLSWQAPPSLDFDAMNEAAALMVGRRDFTSFSKLHTDVKTNICDLRCARWMPLDGDTPHGCPMADRYVFVITADRFLRNMVRAVVGTLVDVGRGKMPPAAVLDILERRDRCAAGTSMPGEPLFLWDIKYPYAI